MDGTTAVLLLLICLGLCLADDVPPPLDTLQRVTIRAGDLTAVIGNHADHGAGRTGYIGIHSLAHTAEAENPICPRYAGIITMREQASVVQISDTEALLGHFASGKLVETIRFKAVSPHYVDIEISAPCSDKGMFVNSCSYMNGPLDRSIHFLDVEGKWRQHLDTQHGNAASVFPFGATLPVLQTKPNARFKHGTDSFADSVSPWRYDPKRAFYYGRFKDMVYQQMFPPECGIIFYMSPTGGGTHPEGRPNPAWDWRGVFSRGTPAGQWGLLRMRLVYKRYVSDEDCLREYEGWVQGLPR